MDPLSAVRTLSSRYGAVVLLKGHVSLISDGQQVIFQRRGSPALAKGGSGDALTGILAALCADRSEPETGDPSERLLHLTALASLWLGLAGERAQAEWGDRSALTGEDLLKLRIGRQGLHASSLVFRSPFDGSLISCTAPLPAELQKLQDEISGV